MTRTIDGELASLKAYRHKESWSSYMVDVHNLDWRDTVIATGYPAALRCMKKLRAALESDMSRFEITPMLHLIDAFEAGEFDDG